MTIVRRSYKATNQPKHDYRRQAVSSEPVVEMAKTPEPEGPAADITNLVEQKDAKVEAGAAAPYAAEGSQPMPAHVVTAGAAGLYQIGSWVIETTESGAIVRRVEEQDSGKTVKWRNGLTLLLGRANTDQLAMMVAPVAIVSPDEEERAPSEPATNATPADDAATAIAGAPPAAAGDAL